MDILQPLEAKVEHQQDCVHHLLNQIQGRKGCKDQVWRRTAEEGCCTSLPRRATRPETVHEETYRSRSHQSKTAAEHREATGKHEVGSQQEGTQAALHGICQAHTGVQQRCHQHGFRHEPCNTRESAEQGPMIHMWRDEINTNECV